MFSDNLWRTIQGCTKQDRSPKTESRNYGSTDEVESSGRPSLSLKETPAENLFEGDENPERGNWTGKLDFLLSCLGYAVGLGNVWRFPYLCYNNGGGAFLVPYCIMLFGLGIPIFLLELTTGQFSAMAPITMFKHYAPGFRGLGIAMFLIAASTCIYYNMIIAWTVYYTYVSMTTDLPWQYCHHDFNTRFCFSTSDYQRCAEENGNETWWIYNYGQCITNTSQAQLLGVNETLPRELRVSPSEEFLERHVLNLSDGVGTLGGIQWGLLVSLLVAWIVVGATLIKGVKSSGKVVYFTALFPYVVLVILLAKGLTLPGAFEGITFYMVPEWQRLTEINIWRDAAIQIFYSLSIGSGGLITLASYNKFNNNVIRDTLIVCFGNCCTSVFAGFVIFSVLGFMAHELGVAVDQVVTSGSGLAFVAYPDLVTRLPVSTLWALLFFLMLFTLGLDSQFATVENIITCILDEIPSLRRKKPLVVISVCLVLFLLGIPLTTQGGRYIIDLMDAYAAGWPLLLVGFSELIVMYWAYGVQNFFRDLGSIQGFNPGIGLKSHLTVVYGTVSPLLVGVILLLSWISYAPLESGGYTYPRWANVVGWTIAISMTATIPLGFLVDITCFQQGSITQRLTGSFQTTDEWYRHSENIARRQKANGDSSPAGGDSLATDKNHF